MVNFGLNSASILGIFLAVAGASLYFMRSVRPELSRDHDIFFAAVGLVCGAILLWSGWRLDPILQLSQFLLTGSAIFFAFEAIRLRGIATAQARRDTPIVDDDRPVSRKYQAATLDDFELDEEERYKRRPRLEESRDSRSSRRPNYETDSPRPRPRPRSDRYGAEERSRPRRSRTSTATADRYEDWEERSGGYEESSYSSSRPRRPRSSRDVSEPAPRRRPRSRPPANYDRDDVDATTVDYVDYQPVEESDEFDRTDDYPADPAPRNRGRDSYESRRDRYGESYEDDYGTPYEDDNDGGYESGEDYEEPNARTSAYEETEVEEKRNPQRYDDRDEERRSPSNFDY